jgi:hypothetical protein
MNATDLQQHLQFMAGRALKNAPRIFFPPPTPVEGDPAGNWTIDLAGVDLFGYDDMIAVVIADARKAILLKID